MAGVPLASAFVRVRPDVDEREFKKDGKAAGETAGKAYADGFYKDAAGRLRKANGEFATQAEKAAIEGGGKSGTGFGKAFEKSFKKSTKDGQNIFGTVAKIAASRVALIGGAAAAATPGVLQLTAALLPATGALVVLPSVMLAVKAASATLKVAVGETGDAIKAGLGDNAKKAADALKELTPAQRAFAKEIIELKPEIEGLKDAVSERFFRPLSDEVEPLAKIYFPLLRKQMSDLAGPLGGLGEQFAESARKAQVFGAVSTLFDKTGVAAVYLRGAIDPLLRALAAVVSATAGELPGLAQNIANVANRFADWVEAAAKSGAIMRAFENGAQTLRDLVGILINVGSIVTSVLRAAGQGSETLLSNFRDLTKQAADFLKSTQGMGALTSVFSTLNAFGGAFRTGLAAVLPAIAESLRVLGPALAAVAQPLADLIVAVAPLLPMLASATATIVRELTPAIAVLSKFLAENTTVVKALAIAYGVWVAALKVSAALIAVNAAGGIVAYLKTLKLVTAATKIATGVQLAYNAVIAINPYVAAAIAIAALVAGIVVAYKRSEKFRAVVQAVWGAIKTAISATVSWITGTAWPAIVGAWEAISGAAVSLYRSVILPVWNGIRLVIQVVVTAIKAFIADLVAAFRAAAAVAMWLYRTIFAPVFAGLRKVAEIWWLAMQILFAAFRKIILGPIMAVLRNLQTFYSLVFRVIAEAARRWWADVQRLFGLFRQYVLGPLLNALTFLRTVFAKAFSMMIATVRNFYNNHLKPVFDQIRKAWSYVAAGFLSIYNNNIKPVFSAFIGFITKNVVGSFRNAVDMIKAAWDKVREYARKPVAFVVNHVINPFINGLNKAASIVGVKDRVTPIAGFASGGQIPGKPSRTDNMLASITGSGRPLAVASGEFITNTKSTLANLPLVKAINAKQGKVTRADVDPYLDGNDGYGRRGGRGDGFGDFFDKAIAPFKGAAAVITNPVASMKKLADAALAKVPGSGMLVDMIKGMSRKVISGAMNWITNAGLGGGALGGGNGPEGWKAKRAIIAKWFPDLRMISGPRPGARTLSGNRSLHADGLAVDYPAVRALAVRIRSLFGKSTQELITPWNDLNILRGRPHRYTGAVWNQHNFAGGNAHVHWGAALGGLVDGLRSGIPVFDSGGTLRPGLNTVYNGLGKPEKLVRADGAGGDTFHFHDGAFSGAIMSSTQAAEDLVVTAIKTARRKRRIS